MKFIEDFKSASLHYYDQLLFVLPRVVLGLLVFIIILFVSKRLKKLLNTYLIGRINDPLLAGFSTKIFSAVMLIVALLISMSIMGLGKAASGLLAGAGVSAFIVGFAFKDIGENFLAGFIMAFDRPFRVGDWVLIAGQEGTIVGLSLRDVHIKTFDGKDVFIPNGMIVRNPITNFTIDGYLRHNFTLKLGPESDVSKATELLYGVLNNIDGVLEENRGPKVFVNNYEYNSLVFNVRYWLQTNDPTVSSIDVKSKAISDSIDLLQKEGFELAVEKIELRK